MKGVYKTKEGQKVEVLDFDEANKIAMIQIDGLQNKWVDEKEYLTWEKEGIDVVEHVDEATIVVTIGEAKEEEVIEESDEEMTESVKKKRIYKKKDK